MATRSHERSTARRSAARTGAAARPYEDEICARDGTGRITYRIEHVARAGATGAMLRDAIGWRYEYTGDRLLRATRYQTGARSCADFVASGGAGVPTDGTQTMTYGPNGVVTGGTSVHCPAAQYDAADRPTCRGRQYDDRSQLSRRTGERITYDVLGRLRSHSQRRLRRRGHSTDACAVGVTPRGRKCSNRRWSGGQVRDSSDPPRSRRALSA